MHQLQPIPLWIGHVGDLQDLRPVFDAGIAALVDLAANEAPPRITRDLVYCRFPLVDGSGNPPWLLESAIQTTAALLARKVPTLVFCSGGMSRSPLIAAAALVLAEGGSFPDRLQLAIAHAPADPSLTLCDEIEATLAMMQRRAS